MSGIEPKTEVIASSRRAIRQAFWTALGGLATMAVLVSIPTLYGNSFSSRLLNIGVGIVGFVVGFLVGKKLASAATMALHQRIPRAKDNRVGKRERLEYATWLSVAALGLVVIIWAAHDQSVLWTQKANGTTAIGQLGKFGFTLIGAFIGHHWELKRHLKELEIVTDSLAP